MATAPVIFHQVSFFLAMLHIVLHLWLMRIVVAAIMKMIDIFRMHNTSLEEECHSVAKEEKQFTCCWCWKLLGKTCETTVIVTSEPDDRIKSTTCSCDAHLTSSPLICVNIRILYVII